MVVVYRSVRFEYDDERALELQPQDEYHRSGFSDGMFARYAPLRGESATLSHRHEGNRRIAQFGYAWKGPAELLTRVTAIRLGTVRIMTWVGERSASELMFDRAELTSMGLGLEHPELQREDVTIEARAIAAELAVFNSLKPDDFI